MGAPVPACSLNEIVSECEVRLLWSITVEDFDAIVKSIDGVGVYDFISRKAMFEGLVRPLVPHLFKGG